MKIRELLKEPKNWTQYYTALDESGEVICPTDPRAVCFCLLGAIRACYENVDEVLSKISNSGMIYMMPERGGTVRTAITSWNDDLDRTFADVKELVTKLDI